MSERRRSTRIRINRDFNSIDEFLTEYAINLSETGVFVRSRTPLAQGTLVGLKFSIVSDDIEIIEGEGVVAHVTERPFPGMGIKFTYLTDASRAIIARYLARA